MTLPTTAVMLGAGNRGFYAYGPYALERPAELRFVAVAEPHPERRARFAAVHGIPRARQFASWEALLAEGQMADVCFNMTQDPSHSASSLAALQAGYDLLLEKPMSPRLEENVALVQAAEQSGRLLQVCHVLRYSPFFAALHDVLESERLGRIVTVEHRENVVFWHMAHSYVRGNWRNTGLSSPMILAKCCHDLDLLQWNLGGSARRLLSFGSLLHFRPENAPPGATLRCTDGCPAGPECPYDARRLYLDPKRAGQWPATVISESQTHEALWQALELGPYGRCVYHCDNDVVDHQTVNMEWDNGATVVLVMHGHSHEEGRTMRYDGTRGTLRGRFVGSQSDLTIHDHLTGRSETIPIPSPVTGHGGGDFGVVEAFLRAVRGEAPALTTAREALESHLLAFAAEESRLTRGVVEMEAFREKAESGISGIHD